MQSTLYIFENLHRNLPPLFPEAIKQKIADALNEIGYEFPANAEELEEVMFGFGYEVWPWNKAYREFLASSKQRMGGHFLTSKSELPINEAMAAIHNELLDFTNQEVLSTEKKNYLNRVNELKMTAQSVREILDYLREVAKAETDHPNLAAEIRSKIRGFEQSLCELGPKLNYHEVKNAADFFRGRREELNRLRGIHHSVVVDFDA